MDQPEGPEYIEIEFTAEELDQIQRAASAEQIFPEEWAKRELLQAVRQRLAGDEAEGDKLPEGET